MEVPPDELALCGTVLIPACLPDHICRLAQQEWVGQPCLPTPCPAPCQGCWGWLLGGTQPVLWVQRWPGQGPSRAEHALGLQEGFQPAGHLKLVLSAPWSSAAPQCQPL